MEKSTLENTMVFARLIIDTNGYVDDHMLISGTGIEGIFGPFGIVGNW